MELRAAVFGRHADQEICGPGNSTLVEKKRCGEDRIKAPIGRLAFPGELHSILLRGAERFEVPAPESGPFFPSPECPGQGRGDVGV